MSGISYDVRKLPVSDIPSFVRILANAYPALGFSNEETQKRVSERYAKMQESPSAVNLYGCYRGETLVGGMALHDFPIRLLSINTMAGGVGMVAVDLPFKKEKIARDMIRFYLKHYRDLGVHLAMLYPFRPDFYKAMGFGIGSKMYQYSFEPSSLPKGHEKSGVRMLTSSDAEAVQACHNKLADSVHGMTYRRLDEVESLFANADSRVAGVFRNEELCGYIHFTFQRVIDTNFSLNDLHAREYVAHEPEDLLQLMSFLRSQSDQVRRVVLTTPDEDFHHFLDDPRDGSNHMMPHVYHQSHAAGVGLMYRILDVPALFADLHEHDFGGVTCSVRLTVRDSLCPEQAGSTVLQFQDGRVAVASLNDETRATDVELQIDIADLSSLLMGTITMKALVRYGKVQLSDAVFLDTLHQAFFVAEKPVCFARF